MTPGQTRKLLEEHGSFHEGHFVLANGGHAQFYINCAAALRCGSAATLIAHAMGPHFLRAHVEVVVTPAYGAVALATPLGDFLEHHGIPHARALVAEKAIRARGFHFSRGAAAELRGKRIGIAEDLWSTGSSTLLVRHAIEAHDGHVVAAGAIVNRGGVTAADIGGGVVQVFALSVVNATVYNAADCPLCAARVPMRVDYGHGAVWLERHPDYPVVSCA